jgi:hypothetical protein
MQELENHPIEGATGPAAQTRQHEGSSETTLTGVRLRTRAARRTRTLLSAGQVLPGSERQVRLLLGLAENIERQVADEARSRLWGVKPLRRLGQTARALAEAHQRRDVPDLLTRLQYRPHLEALLSLEAWLSVQERTPTLEAEAAQHGLPMPVVRRLAAVHIRPTRWKEAVSALRGLLPAPDSRDELLFDLSLSRLAHRGSFDGEDAPPTALSCLLDQADLHDGLAVLVSCYDAGQLAQTLAERYPTLPAMVAGQDVPAVLTRLYSSLHLAEPPDLLAHAQQARRVLLRLGTHWESKRRDITLVYEVYRRLPPGSRVVALLDSSAAHPERQPKELLRWCEWNGDYGSIERLEDRSYRWPLDLVVMEKGQRS